MAARNRPLRWLAVLSIAALAGITGAARAAAAAGSPGRIVILMVWDGLRPDLVNAHDTPNLTALENAGVRFARHHSVFPTLTLVNAAAMATAGVPSSDGVFGDAMYLAPALDMARATAIPSVGYLLHDPLNLENTRYLLALHDARAFADGVLTLAAAGQTVANSGGYVAVLGKQGPTGMFDPEFASTDAAGDGLFVSDDIAAPPAVAAELGSRPPVTMMHPESIAARDAWFARIVTERALPAAKAASDAGRPSLIVYWQHNPDLAQHLAGLGTQVALDAVAADDRNLGAIRKAITDLGIAGRTDLIVVSDHGFATVKAEVPLARLLKAGVLKGDPDANGMVVAHNGGADLVYLPARLEPPERTALMRKIVNYAIMQPWCGPIFSDDRVSRPTHNRNYRGFIAGTFSERAFGLGGSSRSPDLIVSFREFPDESNQGLTGPSNRAIVIGPNVEETVANHSEALVRPIEGVIYSDAPHYTTGMGMHGAFGARELHNVGAAIGPDFRRGYVDQLPTSNSDVAPTIEQILGLKRTSGASGRTLAEALAGERLPAAKARPVTVSARAIDGDRSVTIAIHLTRYDGRDYPDGVSIERVVHH
ncbi:alkaline phosphatase family protein [bacterium]|nr:alkaline phosphatase family protein [bacterium]